MIAIKNISYTRDIRQEWTAPTKEELMVAFEQTERRYPTMGYGTSLTQIKQQENGTWSAVFYRFHSCD